MRPCDEDLSPLKRLLATSAGEYEDLMRRNAAMFAELDLSAISASPAMAYMRDRFEEAMLAGSSTVEEASEALAREGRKVDDEEKGEDRL